MIVHLCNCIPAFLVRSLRSVCVLILYRDLTAFRYNDDNYNDSYRIIFELFELSLYWVKVGSLITAHIMDCLDTALINCASMERKLSREREKSAK